MSQIEKVFEEAHHGYLKKRAILTPDFRISTEPNRRR